MAKPAMIDKLGGNMRASLGAGQGGSRPDAEAAAVRLRDPRYDGTKKLTGALIIEREKIVPDPDQPRSEFDEDSLWRLASSMRSRGQLQPIRVQWRAALGAYMLVAGERRWRAAEVGRIATLLCVVCDDELAPEERLLVQLEENCVREDLRPIEQATAFRKLMDARHWSAAELAEHVNIAESQVVKAVALLRLPRAVQAQVEAGVIAPSTAYEIGQVDDPVAQIELAQVVVAEKLTRGATQERARAQRGGKTTRGRKRVPRPDTWDVRIGKNVVTVTGPAAAERGEALAKVLEEAARRAREN